MNTTPTVNQSALNAIEIISELCSEYSQAESTILLINLIKAFQTRDLQLLSQNQLNKTFHFVNKLTKIYLAIQQISLQENAVEELSGLQENAQVQEPIGYKKDRLQDKIALGSISESFTPNTIIKNFCGKYALYESQLLSDLLTNTLIDTNASPAKLAEVQTFQQDLDDLLKANYLLFQGQL